MKKKNDKNLYWFFCLAFLVWPMFSNCNQFSKEKSGIRLVYEIDIAEFLYNLAKDRDAGLEALLNNAMTTAHSNNEDFFVVLQEASEAQNLRLSRYFGRARDSNSDIVHNLQDEAKDAVTRTVEVVRNRIKQFGVREVSVTNQSDYRIVIELAGIQDPNRAKRLIGRTALLEFQLEIDPEVINSMLAKIDRIIKNQLSEADGQEIPESAEEDSAVKQKIRQETERNMDDLFGISLGETGEADSTDADSTVLVDEDVFQDRPFSSLLANVGGDIGVPTKNLRTVERILNSPEVLEEVRKSRAEFLLTAKPLRFVGQEFYRLYMVKEAPELFGAMIEDARVQLGSGFTAGQPIVSMELNKEGTRIFSRVTGANVGKRLAIVLDGKIVTIPVIRNKIPNGRASIEGMADINEAIDLAIVLRTGALSAPLEIIEETTFEK